MATTIKFIAVGNSTGAIFPKEVLEKLRVSKGDTVHLVETPTGYNLVAYDPELAAQMDVAERVMRRRRTLLKKLAE